MPWMYFPLPINRKGGKEPQGLPFDTPIAGSFLHVEQVCLLVEASASRSARYSRRIMARDPFTYQVVCFQITIIKARHKTQCQ